ncbi:MAG TPA: protein DpdH [Abditibacteriaceae bacterium]|jgi:hypothetical protein
MSFSGYVCWENELLPLVMNPDAFQMDSHVFLATHDPMLVQRVERSGALAGRAGAALTQEQFRDAFLTQGGNYLLSAVLGYTGSGKSHLVRWLWLNIPRTPDRHIVLIPRHGNNLKRVIEQILHGLEGDQFDRYRQRLQRATDKLTTPAGNRELFLNYLCVAIGSEGPHAKNLPEDRDEREEREYLIECLPALFLDNTFRRHLLPEGGIIDDLVNHAIGDSRLKAMESRREFSSRDIAVHEWKINPSSLTLDARDIYGDLLQRADLREQAVKWINTNLDWVFGRMLDIGSEDLTSLLGDVRAILYEQKKELVLLIEDLSNLQGIDNSLLEALLVRPNQEPPLCGLRAAIAVTTGYYGGLPENVRDRVELAVSLDVPRDGGQISADEVARFASRYLNAVRLYLDQDRLAQWHQETLASTQSGTTAPLLPSGCAPCPYRERCHSGFSAVTNKKVEFPLGLYPFTPNALKRMYDRIAQGEYEHFNPRALIKDVLRRTLEDAATELGEGAFPDPATHSRFGRGQMDAKLQEQLRASVPSGQFDRVYKFQDLWGDSSQWPGDPAVIIEAFKIPLSKTPSPPLPAPPDTKKEDVKSSSPEIPTPAPKDEVPASVQHDLKELDDWVNGVKLTPTLAQNLREHLFAAIDSAIDWDGEMLVRSYYAGASKAFQKTSIFIERQPTRRGQSMVQVDLPFEGDFIGTALALRGVLLFAHYGHWDFENGLDHMARYAELIDRAAGEVLRQLRQAPNEESEWNPVPAVVELLAIGAALNGRPLPSHTEDEAEVDALFLNWAEESVPNEPGRSAAWKELLNAYKQTGDKLVDILKSRAGLTKGGMMALQLVDTALFAPTLKRVRSTWKLSAPIPESDKARDDYKPILKLRRLVEEKLATSIEEETIRLQNWRKSVSSYIEPETSASDLVKAIQRLDGSAAAQGVKPGAQWNAVAAPLLEFQNARFDAYWRALAVLDSEEAKIGIARLPFVGRTDFATPITRSSAFFSAASNYLDALSSRVQMNLELLGGNTELDKLQTFISSGLDELCGMVESITASNGPVALGGGDADES